MHKAECQNIEKLYYLKAKEWENLWPLEIETQNLPYSNIYVTLI